MDTLTINPVHLATTLAHERMMEVMGDDAVVDFGDGELSYADEAQDLFNRLYDKFYAQIMLSKFVG